MNLPDNIKNEGDRIQLLKSMDKINTPIPLVFNDENNKSINFGVSSSKGRQTSPELVIINYKGENSGRCESS